jgi:excisionase family DNA binding protein
LPSINAARTADRDAPAGDGDRWLTLGQASRVLNVDESTVRRWADAGQIRTFRTPGGHRRFAERDVSAIVNGREHHRYPDMSNMAMRGIRQQLHRQGNAAEWYTHVDEEQREKLRLLGRRLMTLVADFVARRGRKTPLLEEARRTGAEYGFELAHAGLTLSQAMQAFTFFRRSLDHSAKRALTRAGTPANEAAAVGEQIMTLADEVLLGIAGAYERADVDGARAQEQV